MNHESLGLTIAACALSLMLGLSLGGATRGDAWTRSYQAGFREGKLQANADFHLQDSAFGLCRWARAVSSSPLCSPKSVP